jgi:hypothetical protein
MDCFFHVLHFTFQSPQRIPQEHLRQRQQAEVKLRRQAPPAAPLAQQQKKHGGGGRVGFLPLRPAAGGNQVEQKDRRHRRKERGRRGQCAREVGWGDWLGKAAARRPGNGGARGFAELGAGRPDFLARRRYWTLCVIHAPTYSIK